MPDPSVPDITLVERPERLPTALTTVDEFVVGVDVERADANAYFRRPALVQVGVARRCVLVDAVCIHDLTALDRFLRGRLAVLHAFDNDVEPLAARAVDLVAAGPGVALTDRVADTAIAAALLGLPTGLPGLLAEVAGIERSDDKARFQRADWEARPLPEELAAYAADDVVHLPALWRRLHERLAATGRFDWYAQELSAVAARCGRDDRHWTRVRAAAALSPERRAVLRAVWDEREALARAHDIAPNRLLHDDLLRAVAADPPGTAAALTRLGRTRGRRLPGQHADRLYAAIQRGLAAPPEGQPGRRWSPRQRDAFDALRRARAQVARDVGIEPGVLCPAGPLKDAVRAEPGDGEELCAAAGLRPWQTMLLAAPLWAAYRRVRDG